MLDANCDYWQIGVAPADRDKTPFTSHRGLYHCKRIPFGLVSAPAKFQRTIDVVLCTVRFQCALTYLDDIVIYSATFEQNLIDLTKVLKLLEDAGVSLKFSKCSFAAYRVQYLGYKFWRAEFGVDDSKKGAVIRAVPPKNKTGLRRFLGMTGYYRRFIKIYSVVAAALNKYLKGDRE
jgi:Reverse transcriptase (RNA-dependent DNA polymerase)